VVHGPLHQMIKTLQDLPPKLIDEIEAFFVDYHRQRNTRLQADRAMRIPSGYEAAEGRDQGGEPRIGTAPNRLSGFVLTPDNLAEGLTDER
jgi:hypothetical protein